MTDPTIYALGTPTPTRAHPGALAVVRLSGPRAGEAVEQLTRRPLPEPRRMVLRALHDPSTGEVFDKALVARTAGAEDEGALVTNLMSVDAQRLQDNMTYMFTIVSGVYQIVATLYLLYGQLGPASFGGLAVMLIFMPVTQRIVLVTRDYQKVVLEYKDRRIKLQSEALAGMKIVKLYGWEPPLGEELDRLSPLDRRTIERLDEHGRRARQDAAAARAVPRRRLLRPPDAVGAVPARVGRPRRCGHPGARPRGEAVVDPRPTAAGGDDPRGRVRRGAPAAGDALEAVAVDDRRGALRRAEPPLAVVAPQGQAKHAQPDAGPPRAAGRRPAGRPRGARQLVGRAGGVRAAGRGWWRRRRRGSRARVRRWLSCVPRSWTSITPPTRPFYKLPG